MNYNFIVNNEIIRGRPDLKLYTGNTGTYTFEFEFDEQWADLQIFVAFTGNSGTYVSKAENNRVTVPRELLVSPGSCRFGVYGTNSSDDIKRMSSNLIELEVVQGAYSDGTAPAVPTPDLWEVLVTKTVPIIGENGNWWIWSMEEQGYIDSGVYASQKYDDTAVRQAIEDINSGKVDKIDGKALSANDFTDEDKAKLDSLNNYNDAPITDALERKEEKANKVTVLSDASTDEQYPSALAVKNYVDNTQPDLSGYMKTMLYVMSDGGFQAGTGSAAIGAGGAIGCGTCAEDGGGAVGKEAYASWGGGAVGSTAKALFGGGAAGKGAAATEGGAVGSNARAGRGFAGGYNAKVNLEYDFPIDAIQLGTGTNSEAKTLQIYSYTLLNADGTIPDERIPGLKPAVITSITDNTLLLNNNQDARLGEMTELILTMPESIPKIYESCFSFASGSTATVLICSGTPLIWRGDDVDSEGIFTPEANTVYEVNIKNLGINGIVARVGAV